MTMGIVFVAFFSSVELAAPLLVTITSTLRRTSSAPVRKSIYFPFCGSVLDGDVSPLDITELAKPLAEMRFRSDCENPDPDQRMLAGCSSRGGKLTRKDSAGQIKLTESDRLQ